jgi:hypothetical protein
MIMRSMDPRETAIEEVLKFMHRHKLTISDLTECCGSQINSSNRKIADRARAVSRCWDMMAREGVKYSQIEIPAPKIDGIV